jgi:dTDP-4-dehydrorhamnose reductase
MRKLIITGASGFLGWNLCRIAQAQWEVIGLSHSHDIASLGITCEKCDITDSPALDKLFDRLKPDAVIHAAAISDPNYCELNVSESSRVNVDASEHIASLCKKFGSRCAFTSTDLVFDGNRPPYAENHTIGPVSTYGTQKVEAETRMLRVYSETLICRMPLMFGDHPGHAKSFIQPMIDLLRHGKELSLFIDEFRTPVSGQDAARGILDLLTTQRGIFHLGGPVRISRYDFGLLLGKCLGLESFTIHPIFQKDVKMAASRPKDVSLASSKAFSLGYCPDEPEKALMKLECINFRNRLVG